MLSLAATVLGVIVDLLSLRAELQVPILIGAALAFVLSLATLGTQWQEVVTLRQEPRRALRVSIWLPALGLLFSTVMIGLMGRAIIRGTNLSPTPKSPSPTPLPTLPAPVTAEIGVLVAGFVDRLAECTAPQLGYQVRDEIVDELRLQVNDVLNLAPDLVIFVPVQAVCDEEAARVLGDQLNADLVIWGSIPPDEQQRARMYRIRFTVVDPGEAAEIARTMTDTVSEDDVLTRLSAQARPVLAAIVGLIQSMNDDHDSAANTFTQALKSDWFKDQEFSVRAALSMFTGRELAAIGRQPEAVALFDQILHQEPYSWAYVGKGMLDYARGLPAAGRSADCALLTQAGSAFRQALTDPQLLATVKSNATYVDAKAHYGLGGVYLELGQHCDLDACCELEQAQPCDPQTCLNSALREFQAALDEYTRLKAPGEYTSQAHYGIGRVYHVLSDLDRAYQEYDRCVEVADKDPAMREYCTIERDKLATPTPTP
jgi:tetratricopeptide (TPR) repeat protein